MDYERNFLKTELIEISKSETDEELIKEATKAKKINKKNIRKKSQRKRDLVFQNK